MSDIRVGIKLTTDGSGKVTAEITQVKKGIEETGKAAEQAGSKQKKAAEDTKRAYSGLAGQIDGVKKAFLAYVSVQAAWNGAKAAVATADAWTNLNSKLRVVTGTQQELGRALSDVSAIANRYQADINSVGAAYNRLAPIAANMGKSQDDLRTGLESVSAALKLSGASTSEASETLRQFGQALSGPTVQMEEMNTIIDSASVLWQGLQRQFPELIAKYGSLKEAVGKGALSNRDLLDATIRLREEFDAQASTMTTTVSGAWQVFKNELEKSIGQIDQGTGATNDLAVAILDLASAFHTITPAAAGAINSIARWVHEAIIGARMVREELAMTLREMFTLQQNAGNTEALTQRDLDFAAGRLPLDQIVGPPPGQAGQSRFDGINRSAQGAADSVGRLNQKIDEFSRKGAQASRNEINAYLESTSRGAEAAAQRLMHMGTVQKKVYDEAMRQGVNPAFALAIAQRESQFRQNVTSPAGAHGVMQLMPGTARRFGVDINDIDQNVQGGVKYLKLLLEKFNGDMRLAAAAYNAGEHRKSFQGPSPQVPAIAETQKYVGYVRRNYERWSSQLGTGGGFSSFYDDAQGKAFDAAVSRINQRMAEADAARKVELEKIKQDLLVAEQLADKAEKNAEVKIKMVVDPASQTVAEQAIAEAQKKRADAIQKFVNVTSGVNDAKDRLKAIEDELKAAQKYQQEEGKITELQSKRKQAILDIKTAETAAQSEAIKIQKERQDSAQKFDAMQRDMQKQAASDNVVRIQQEIEGNKALFEVKSRAADYSQAVMSQYADDQKAAIDAGLEQARTQVAANEAERASILQTKDGLAAIMQERENITASLTDGLALLDQERQAALDKLNIDAQQLDYQRQIAEWQLQQTQAIDPNDQNAILAARQKVLEIEGQITENAQKQLDVMNSQTGQQAKLRAEAAKALATNNTKTVKEIQLEQNAFWDQALQRAQQYAATWERIVGAQSESGKAMAELSIAMVQYGKNITQIEQRYKDLGSDENIATGQTKQRDLLRENLDILSKTALSMRSMFKEGTEGYGAMTAAAGAMQIAVQALNIVDGISAVLNQLKGSEPYSAIPRALLVAGMVASLGVSIGGMGGGAMAGPTRPEGKQTGANGGVFGDNSAKSDSILKSIQEVAQYSNANLDYSAGMLRALKNIESSMGGVTNAVIRGVQAVVPANMDLGHTKIGSGIFAGVDKYISDYGIVHWGQKLTDILKTGFEGNVFTDITREVKVFGSTFSKEVRKKFSDLDAEVAGQFTRTIVNIVDVISKAGKAFGVSGEELNRRIQGFVLKLGTTSLQGLKGDDLQKAIEAMFSGAADSIARQMLPGLEDFQKIGEGYFQTAVRVSNAIEVAKGQLSQFGIAMVKLSDVVYKQGDIAAELVRQSITGFEGSSSTIGKYLDSVSGTADELIAVYQDLLNIRAVSAVVGLSFKNLSNDMLVAAGGVAALKESLSYYLENFFGPGEQAAAAMAEFSKSMRNLGIKAIPETKDAFKALLNSFDQTTEAGQKLYAQVLKLAPAFIKAAETAKALEDLYNKLTGSNPWAELDQQWTQLWDDWSSVMAGKLAQVRAPFDVKEDAQRSAILGWQQAIAGAQSAIGVLTGELVRLSLAKAPAEVLKNMEKAIASLVGNISEWVNNIRTAQDAIKKIREESKGAVTAEQQNLLRDQGYSLINNLLKMWTQLISGIRSMQESLQDQIDDLTTKWEGVYDPNASLKAKAFTANQRVTSADAALAQYRSGGGNDPAQELALLQQVQSAVMARYNAELAKLQQAQQEMVAAETERLNAALEVTIEAINKELDAKITAINAALDVEIQSINDALDARIKAQQSADEATIKSMQQSLDTQIKAQQKADEAAIKSMQKRFDAENKAIQKQYEATIKARQKEFDAANKLTQRQFDAERKALQKRQDEQMKVLSDELDAANQLRDAIKSIADYAQSMKLGAASPFSPEQRLAEAQSQYQSLLAKANAGDADAMAKLSSASDAYLEAARNYYGSSTNYEDIFAGVQRAMEAIGGMSAPDPNSIQSRIDALRESQEADMQALQDKQDAIMETIRESQQDAIDALRETQQEQLDAIRETQQAQVDAARESQQGAIESMREASQAQIEAVREQQQKVIEALRKEAQDQIDAARKTAKDQIDAARKQAEADIAEQRKLTEQAIRDLSDPEKNQAIKDLKERTIAKLEELRAQADALEAEARAKAEQWRQDIIDWLTNNQDLMNGTDAANLKASLDAIGKIINPAYAAPSAYAKGGQALPGYALVGEQGPELVRFNSTGQVYTAKETRSMLQSGSDEETKAILREIKTETKASVTVQSAAFQRMIDKLNSLDDRINSMERNRRLNA